MRCTRPVLFLTLTVAALASSVLGASAQSSRSFDIPAPSSIMVWDFDMWCRTMQMYPAERCETRDAQDIAAYQAYVARNARFATAREYKPWLAPMRVPKTNPGYQPPF